MKIIIILTIFLSFNLYGYYNLSMKGGLNYSKTELREYYPAEDKYEMVGVNDYKLGGAIFVSWKRY